MSDSLTFLDFFAGIGGFRRGMELAGHECIGFCEFDKAAAASYTMMHLVTDEQRKQLLEMPMKDRLKAIRQEEYRNGDWYANDVRTVDSGSLPHADCWCFGFPCQDISVSGKQLGFAGKRSSLFFAVTGLIRDLEEKNKPRILFIENVKNLLSVNGGFDFAKLLIEMGEIGYDAEWAVLNSKDFGVPHNRERVFIIGHLRGRGGREVFPLGGTNQIHNPTAPDGKIYKIASCLTAGGNDKWNGDYIVKQIGNCMATATRDNPNQGRIYDTSGIAPCLSKMDGGGREPMIPVSGVAIPVLTPDRMEKRQNGRRFKNNEEAMFTLTSQDRHGVMVSEATKKGYAIAWEGDSINLAVPRSKTRRGRVGKGIANILDTGCNQGVAIADGVYTGASSGFNRGPLKDTSRCLKSEKADAGVYDGMRIRRLTPRECFRLQGWEDIYFERAASVNADSQLYKQAGNGVTVNVIRAIAERLG